MEKKNTHPLAWGTIDGPKGVDNNSWAAKMAAAALKKEADEKAERERKLCWSVNETETATAVQSTGI